MRAPLLVLPLVLVAACSSSKPVDPMPGPDAGTVPDTQLTATPGAVTSQTTATFEFRSDDASATFLCALEGLAAQPCTSPASFTVGEGAHTIAVTARNGVGNDPTPASFSWTVDTQPPDTFLAHHPDDPTNVLPEFQLAATEDSTFRCALDGAPETDCLNPTYLQVADGPHTFTARAIDRAGNADPTPASFSWTEDTQAPQTSISAGPSGTVHSGSAQFTFASSESGSTFACSLDGAAPTACTSPVTYDVDTGAHSFSVTATDAVGNVDPTPATQTWTYGTRIRVMAGNLTTGNYQSYDDQTSQAAGCVKTSGYGTGEGKRIFQGLQPDIVAIQELRYWGCDHTNSEAHIRSFIDDAFGSAFSYYREPYTASGDLPNGIVSRYPIVATGDWADPVQTQPNRGFAWAQIQLPGGQDLYVISVHLLTSSETDRDSELQTILAQINSQFPAGAWVVLAGDFNTHSRTEAGITDVSSEFVTASPWPADQNANSNTNSIRAYPDDWVLASSGFNALARPVVIGGSTFKDGLVFDSRVYSPLSEVTPVLSTDSGGSGMQHMGVVRDFYVP